MATDLKARSLAIVPTADASPGLRPGMELIGMPRSFIARAQRALVALGFDPGTIDGVIGWQTTIAWQAALAELEERGGLAVGPHEAVGRLERIVSARLEDVAALIGLGFGTNSRDLLLDGIALAMAQHRPLTDIGGAVLRLAGEPGRCVKVSYDETQPRPRRALVCDDPDIGVVLCRPERCVATGSPLHDLSRRTAIALRQ